MSTLPQLSKPEPKLLRQYIDQQRRRDLNYEAVGATATQPPPGYVVDHTRVCLGEGDEVFALARRAIAECRQFDLGWLEAAQPPAVIREGEIVTVLARLMGLWWLNACRIVYVIDQPLPRFGFAYGTVAGHVETGEERFLVEMDDEGRVWYDILAFSRPQRLLARLGYPYVRLVQKRFGRDSAARMRRAATVAEIDAAKAAIGD